jgi:hypothetical protein
MPRLCTKVVTCQRFPNRGKSDIRAVREEWSEVTRRWVPIARMLIVVGGSIPGTVMDESPDEIIVAMEGDMRIRLPRTHFTVPKVSP